MRFFRNVVVVVLAVIMAVMFAACRNNNPTGGVTGNDDKVVITINVEYMEITEDTTLLDYMNKLEENGEISFIISDGMITEINGVKNGSSTYWMLYTDDSENSNTAWGQIEYDGKIYGIAALGAGELVIKDGLTYIWYYQAL